MPARGSDRRVDDGGDGEHLGCLFEGEMFPFDTGTWSCMVDGHDARRERATDISKVCQSWPRLRSITLTGRSEKGPLRHIGGTGWAKLMLNKRFGVGGCLVRACRHGEVGFDLHGFRRGDVELMDFSHERGGLLDARQAGTEKVR